MTKEKAPLAILIHGWGDHSVIPFKLMVDGLVRRGTACFVLYLPFHTGRLSKELVFKLSHLTPDEWFAGYQIAVTDVRQIIDWAGQNGKTDMSLITVIGLSLGAFVGSMAMGVDRRVKAGVFVVHGGNIRLHDKRRGDPGLVGELDHHLRLGGIGAGILERTGGRPRPGATQLVWRDRAAAARKSSAEIGRAGGEDPRQPDRVVGDPGGPTVPTPPRIDAVLFAKPRGWFVDSPKCL